MNKKNKILVACLALLLVLSVGYALFSETITINGTATAKGNFAITSSCEKGYSNALIDAGIYSNSNEGQSGYANDSCSVNNNVVSFKTGLEYPSAKRQFTIKMTNTGTINAEIDLSVAKEDYAVSNLTEKVCPLNQDGTVSTNCTDSFDYVPVGGGSTSTNAYTYEIILLENEDGFCLPFDGYDCVTDFMASNGNFRLKTGESIYYLVGFRWPQDYASGYENGFEVTGSMEVPFVQETVN